MKVRGYRIELNQIEAALMSFADIKEAGSRGGRSGSQQTACGFLRLGGKAINERRRFETRTSNKGLPRSIIPSSFFRQSL